MKHVKIPHTETTHYYALSDEENERLRFFIDYCWHRATKHNTPVSDYIKELKKWRKTIN